MLQKEVISQWFGKLLKTLMFRTTEIIHLAARYRYLSICQLILENIDEKNPKSNGGWTPLHLAARNSHLSVLSADYGKNWWKNSNSECGWTPLHSDAQNSHFSVCQLIVENVDDKNPEANNGWTYSPLIFVWFISNFLCMCSNSMTSAHVILK